MNRKLTFTLAIFLAMLWFGPTWTYAGTEDRQSDINLKAAPTNYAEFPEIAAPSGNPVTNKGWLYVKDNTGVSDLYFEDDAGTVTDLTSAGAPAFSAITDPAADTTLSWSTDKELIMTSANIAADPFTFRDTGAIGNISILKVQQLTGNPTDGTVLEVTASEDIVDGVEISNTKADLASDTALLRLDYTDDSDANGFYIIARDDLGVTADTVFSLSNDGAIAGGAAGDNYTMTSDGALTLKCDSAATAMTIAPDAVTTLGIDITDTTLTNAISVGDNAILGTTGLINYTNFDVDASGNIVSLGNLTAVDGTFSGNVNVTGTIKMDAVVAATAATTITVDGTGVGGVTVGGTSTGTVTLGGGATLVNLPSTVDLVLAGGDLTATDTANADMVTFTNNTMTTADLLVLSASGTRTSDNVIEITDGATTGDTIGITANAQTSGYGITYSNSGAALTGAGINLAITDGAGFTGSYVRCYDGAAEDFTVKRYGATTIAGNASTNVLTVTTGDVQVDAGKVEITTTDDESTLISRNQGATTTPVLAVTETAAAADSPAILVDQNATAAGSYGLEVDSAGGTMAYLNAEAATGDGIVFAVPAAYTGQLIKVDDTLLGTNGEGVIDIRGTHATPVAGMSLVRLDLDTGTLAGATDGFALSVDDDSGAAATSYAVKIDSASNEALHVATGKALFDEAATFTAGTVLNGDLDFNSSASTEEVDISTDSAFGADGALVTINNTVADVTNAMYLLRLRYTDNDDVDADFIVAEDNNGDDVFVLGSAGEISTVGSITQAVANTQLIGSGTTEQVGYLRDVVDGGATNPYTVTAAMSGTVFINSQAIQFNLPAAAAGKTYTFIVQHGSNLDINPDNADTIYYVTGMHAGDILRSATVGDQITLFGVSDSTWIATSVTAQDGALADTIWTDGGAGA